MVSKLLKHEYLRTRNTFGLIFGIAIAAVLVSLLLYWTQIPVISALGILLGIVPIFTLALLVQLVLAFDYWNSSYRRTGYFTHSIPVKSSTIFWVKFLWGMIVSSISWILSIAIGYVMLRVIMPESKVMIREIWQNVTEVMPGWGWVLVAIAVIVFLTYNLIHFYFAVSIGAEDSFNRMGIGGPILVWVILYVAVQILMLAGIVAIPLGIGFENGQLTLEGVNYFAALLHNESPSMMPAGFLVIYALIVPFLLWRTVKSWNKKISLVA